MKIFVLTNMYPKSHEDIKGIFVKEQVESLASAEPVSSVEVFNIDEGGGVKTYIFSVVKVLRKLFEVQPDVIHVHYGLTFLPLLIAYPFLRKFRIVVTFHGSDLLGENRVVTTVSKIASRLSDASIIVSEEMRGKLCGAKNVYHIPCAIDKRFFNIKRSLDEIKPILIFPSNPLRPEKNYSYFARVVEMVGEKNIPFECVDMVALDRNMVVDLFKKASAILLTSDREGSPQVVKEALAAGLPVVARKVGDLSELVDKVDGLYLVDGEEEMASLVYGILVRDDIKISCNVNARSLFSSELAVEKLIKAYT